MVRRAQSLDPGREFYDGSVRFHGDNLAAHIGAADVVIDFSFHSATLAVAQLCAQHKKPLVIGTTGHTAEEKAAINAAIKGLPVVWAGNYSVGVTLLNALVRQAARSLADAGRWDVEVLEMHHRLKKDAPAGTAESRARAEGRGMALRGLVWGWKFETRLNERVWGAF